MLSRRWIASIGVTAMPSVASAEALAFVARKSITALRERLEDAERAPCADTLRALIAEAGVLSGALAQLGRAAGADSSEPDPMPNAEESALALLELTRRVSDARSKGFCPRCGGVCR